MAATILEKRYTKQDVLDLPDAVQYELVDGIPTERPVSWETSAIAVEVSSVGSRTTRAQTLWCRRMYSRKDA